MAENSGTAIGNMGKAGSVATGMATAVTPIDNLLNFIGNGSKPAQPDAPAQDGQLDTVDPMVGVMEAALAASAEREANISKVKSDTVNTQVGTIKTPAEGYTYTLPKGRELARFGNVQVVKTADGTEVTLVKNTPDKTREINVAKVVDNMASGIKSFDIDAEFKKMQGITDLAQKEDFARMITLNAMDRMASIRKEITEQAAIKAGVNEAQAAVQANLTLDTAAIAAGRIRQGDVTVQTQRAQAQLQAALTTANALENDLLKSHPEMAKLLTYNKFIERELGQIDRSQQRKESVKDRLPFVMTDERMTNVKFALGITENNSAALEDKFANAILKDKALLKVTNADKNTLPVLLVDEDATVRKYAFNIIKESEKQLNNGDTPAYINSLEKLVMNREALLKPDDMKELQKSNMKVTGEKEKGANKTTTLINSVMREIEETGKNRYMRMDLWQFNEPTFRPIIDGLKTTDKEGKVLMHNGVAAIMTSSIKKADGTEMTPYEKIDKINESLKLSMDNAKKSMVLPSAGNYYQEYATIIRNQAMRAYFRDQIRKNSALNFPLVALNELSDIPADIATGISSGVRFIKKLGE